MSLGSFRQKACAVAVTVGLLLLPACGSRLDEQQAADQLRSLQSARGSGVVTGPAADAATGGDESTGEGAGASVSTDSGVKADSGDAGLTDSDGGSSGSSGSDASATSGAEAGPGAAPAAPDSGAGGAKAPIVLGVVGNFSGVLGSAYAPARDAAAAWAKTVNAKGGIDGHKVTLLIADNRNSGANDIANVRRLVENEGAVAIFNFFPAAGGADGVGKYAQDNKIAIVGGSGYDPAWNQYVGMFPVTTGDVPQSVAWAVAMKRAGKKKVASTHCTEDTACADKQRVWKQAAVEMGLDVVYEGRVSIAQPDYTSSCTSARSAGAEAMLTIVDGASTYRYARDCTRQGYKHTIVWVNPFNETPPSMEGAIAPITSFPWFLTSGSPGIEEYAKAMKKYVPRTNNFSATAWTGGKLLEKALPGSLSSKPTSAEILRALYKIKNETLGGMSQPLTFTAGKRAPIIPCAWNAVIKAGKWTAPDGLKATLCS